MHTKIQSPGFLFPGLLMAIITIFPINRSEAQMKLLATAKVDLTQSKGQIGDIHLGKNTRPVERPGPPKPKKPVVATTTARPQFS